MRSMTASPEWRWPADALPPGQSEKFRLACGERAIDGFVIHHQGGYAAYVNRCPHVGTPLDLWPNEFLADDGRTLVCSTHGALFTPDTGRCTAGPCAGDVLTPLPLRLDGATLVVTCPASRPARRPASPTAAAP
jgi:nitrite reductase/ring-hydroxylating ferredoxin subunit